MAQHFVFTNRSLLAAAIEELGGTQLVFRQVLTDDSFRMQVSFAVPSRADPGVMQSILALGEISVTEHDAEESACAVALRTMWQDYAYIALDFSLLRVWCCKERHSGLLEKLQQSRSIWDDISNQAFEAFESIQSAAPFALRTVADLRNVSADGAIVSAALSSMGFLQMMHVRGGMVQDQVMLQYQVLINHEDIGQLLPVAGFTLPSNSGVGMNIIGGLRMMVDRLAEFLGYNHPCYRFVNRGPQHRCILDFSPIVEGLGHYKTASQFSPSVEEATKGAMYNTLLAFSVNQNIEINDTNRAAYIFAKERVDQVSSDVEVLGNMGSALCSYLDTTRKGLELIMRTYSEILRRHPCAEQLVAKVETIIADVEHCLTAITPSVRVMNENLVVALLDF